MGLEQIIDPAHTQEKEGIKFPSGVNTKRLAQIGVILGFVHDRNEAET